MKEALLRKTIAENITYYRKQAGLTQYELSEKINYSDKSVSKWERGEGIPDILVLAELAELFGVSVNDLVYPGKKIEISEQRMRTRVFITLLAVVLPWLVAAVLFFALRMLMPGFDFAWNLFLYAIAVSGIVATILTSLWFSHLFQMVSVSMIVWGTALSVHGSFRLPQVVYVFIVAAVMQILTLLWYGMKYFSKRNKT